MEMHLANKIEEWRVRIKSKINGLKFCEEKINRSNKITSIKIIMWGNVQIYEANKIYKLRISVDSSRFARVYINNVQYSVTTFSGADTNVEPGAVPSKQLKDNTSLIPFIGIQNDNIHFNKC